MASYYGSTNAAVNGWVNPRTLPPKPGSSGHQSHLRSHQRGDGREQPQPRHVQRRGQHRHRPGQFGTIHYRAAASKQLGQAVGGTLRLTQPLGVWTLQDDQVGSLRYALSNALPGTTIYASATARFS